MPGCGLGELTTGVREIDADIEGLSFLMSRIFDPLVECRRRDGPCDHRQCTRIEAILRYMTRSFGRQEKLMTEGAYPTGGEHQRDHEQLVADLTKLQAARVCADRDHQLVRDAVADWTLVHHRSYDRPLGNWAVTRRILPPAP